MAHLHGASTAGAAAAMAMLGMPPVSEHRMAASLPSGTGTKRQKMA